MSTVSIRPPYFSEYLVYKNALTMLMMMVTICVYLQYTNTASSVLLDLESRLKLPSADDGEICLWFVVEVVISGFVGVVVVVMPVLKLW